MVPIAFGADLVDGTEPLQEREVLLNTENAPNIIGNYDSKTKTITYTLLKAPAWDSDGVFRIHMKLQAPEGAAYAMPQNPNVKFNLDNEGFISFNMRLDRKQLQERGTATFEWYTTDGKCIENETDFITINITYAYIPVPVPADRFGTEPEGASKSNGIATFSLDQLTEQNIQLVFCMVDAPENAVNAKVFADDAVTGTAYSVENHQIRFDTAVPADGEKLETNYKIEWIDGESNPLKMEALTVRFRAVTDTASWTPTPYKNLYLNKMRTGFDSFSDKAIEGLNISVKGFDVAPENLDEDTSILIDTSKMTLQQWEDAFYNFTEGNLIYMPASVKLENGIELNARNNTGFNLGELSMILDDMQKIGEHWNINENAIESVFVPIARIENNDGQVIILPCNNEGRDTTLKWTRKGENGPDEIIYTNIRTEFKGGEVVTLNPAVVDDARLIKNANVNELVDNDRTAYRNGILTYYANVDEFSNQNALINTNVNAPDGAVKAEVYENGMLTGTYSNKQAVLSTYIEPNETRQSAYLIKWYSDANIEEQVPMKQEIVRIEIVPQSQYIWPKKYWTPADPERFGIIGNANEYLNGNSTYNEDGGMIIDIKSPETFNFREMMKPENTDVFAITAPAEAETFKIRTSGGPLMGASIAEMQRDFMEAEEQIPIDESDYYGTYYVNENRQIVFGTNFVREFELGPKHGLLQTMQYYALDSQVEGIADFAVVQWYDKNGNLIQMGPDNDKDGEYVYIHKNPYVNEVKTEIVDDSTVKLEGNPIQSPMLIMVKNPGGELHLNLEKFTKDPAKFLEHDWAYFNHAQFRVEMPPQNHEGGKDVIMEYSEMKLIDAETDRVIHLEKGEYVAVLLPYPEGISYDQVKGKYLYLHHYDNQHNLVQTFDPEGDKDILLPVPAGLFFVTDSFSPFVLEAGQKPTEPVTPPSGGGGGAVVPPADSTPEFVLGEGGKAEYDEKAETVTITPEDGYTIKDVLVNGVSVGRVSVIENVKPTDKIEILFESPAERNARIIAGVQATKLKARSEADKGYIRIKWSKSAGYKVDYYEVYKAKSKKALKAGKTPYFKTKSGSVKSYRNSKGLKKGTRYYYRVRGVRKINGQTYYTNFSTVAYRAAK